MTQNVIIHNSHATTRGQVSEPIISFFGLPFFPVPPVFLNFVVLDHCVSIFTSRLCGIGKGAGNYSVALSDICEGLALGEDPVVSRGRGVQ